MRRTARSSSRGRTTHFHDDDLEFVRRGEIRRETVGRPSHHIDDEANELTSRIDSRGRMGEAWGGATKDWTIVDVPPGTERVRMDGKGGGSTDTTWTKYSGVRRTQFIPERDGVLVPVRKPSPSPIPPLPSTGRDRLSVSVHDRNTEIDIEKTTERRLVRAPQPPPPPPQPILAPITTKREMWTEITRDLVTRDAIVQLGYEFEETPFHFYIMDYLRYVRTLSMTLHRIKMLFFLWKNESG